jgi:hypothetical protein
MCEYQTTILENMKARVRYLRETELQSEAEEWGKAICEELERIHARLDSFIKQAEDQPED